MKSIIKNIGSIFVISIIITACSSGKSMLEKGNYYEAVIQSVNRLKSNPNNKRAQETLAYAYPNAVNSFLDKIENNIASNYRFRNTEAVSSYGYLNQMYESIQHSPGAKSVIKNPNKYYNQLSDSKIYAAEEQYIAGQEQLSFNTRGNAKQAYFYFLKADKFSNNYKDVSSKIDESFNLSILKVITHLKPIQSKQYELSADVFYSEVHKIFRQIEQNEFIRFFSQEEAKLNNLSNPDQHLSINFEDFIVGETHVKERIEKMTLDSVKVGEVELSDKTKQEVYGTVKATVSINRMEVISRGLINLTLSQVDNSNRVVIDQNFAGDYVWFNEWGNFNGDERALTDTQYAICKRRRINPVPPQQMFVEFTKPIYSQLNTRLVSFYKNY